jgi:hypothetical protein
MLCDYLAGDVLFVALVVLPAKVRFGVDVSIIIPLTTFAWPPFSLD